LHFKKKLIKSPSKNRSLLYNKLNMSFAPKKKTSKSNTNVRTTNWIKLKAKKLKDRVMLNKDETGLSHFMAEDGTYNGREVVRAKIKKTNTTRI